MALNILTTLAISNNCKQAFSKAGNLLKLYYYYYYLLLNVQFGSLLGPRGLLLIYMWGENSFKKTP